MESNIWIEAEKSLMNMSERQRRNAYMEYLLAGCEGLETFEEWYFATGAWVERNPGSWFENDSLSGSLAGDPVSQEKWQAWSSAHS